MPTLQSKFQTKLSKLKVSADAKREALEATCNTKREELAKLVKDSTDKNRQFFAIYLGLLVYVLLMVFSTKGQQLLILGEEKMNFLRLSLNLLRRDWRVPCIFPLTLVGEG